MNTEILRKNILEKQAWLERALLAIDACQLWHTDKDKEAGSYMSKWIRQQLARKIKLGQCLTGDMWPGRARYIMQQYVPELLRIAYDKAVADAKKYTILAKGARIRAKQLKKELNKKPEEVSKPPEEVSNAKS